MAIRETRLLIKNNNVPNAPFSGATLLKGEAIVNVADGIMMFSGNTLSTTEWTPAGTGANANFFEVGSNLRELRLRDKLTKYQGLSGNDLVGKFLSGTTEGFVLANISDIQGNDTFITGGTYFTGGTLEFEYNNGNSFQITGLTQDLDLRFNNLVDDNTIEFNSDNKIKLKDIVSAPSGGTRVFLGNTEIGSGGSIGNPGVGNLIIHGDLTVFGNETIVATNELYVEDPQITLNYNPTGSTVLTSISSGIKIQDGNGTSSGHTYFTIATLYQSSISGDTSEYNDLVGYSNRGWVTQLNDIIIRNTNLDDTNPNGVRVLAEGDILDAGQY